LDQLNPYFKQAALLIKVLPAIGESGCFLNVGRGLGVIPVLQVAQPVPNSSSLNT
jgi:hypothetical protein